MPSNCVSPLPGVRGWMRVHVDASRCLVSVTHARSSGCVFVTHFREMFQATSGPKSGASQGCRYSALATCCCGRFRQCRCHANLKQNTAPVCSSDFLAFGRLRKCILLYRGVPRTPLKPHENLRGRNRTPRDGNEVHTGHPEQFPVRPKSVRC